MKKNYESPAMEVVRFSLNAHILTGSPEASENDLPVDSSSIDSNPEEELE